MVIGRKAGLGANGLGRSGKQGFTLLEVLLSLMLIAMILVATTFFIFSMGELWGRGADVRLFDRHTRGLTRFLQGTIDRAAIYWDAENTDRVLLMQPPGVGHFDESLITFEVAEAPPFLVWPEVPLPSVVCYLQMVPDEGLYLLWHSRLEVDFEEQEPRRTQLSPFVTGLIYDYYDPETEAWNSHDRLETDSNGDPLLPERLRLVFHHDRMDRETVLTLPNRNATVNLF